MKTIIFSALLTAFIFPHFSLAEEGCAKGQDACSASAPKASGFLQAVEAAQKKPVKAAAAPKAVPSKSVKPPVQADGDASALEQPGDAIPPEPVQTPGTTQEKPSKPAWLLLAGGGLIGLYYYLKEGKRKGRKK